MGEEAREARKMGEETKQDPFGSGCRGFPAGMLYAVDPGSDGLRSLWFIDGDGEHRVIASLHDGESYLDEENLAALFNLPPQEASGWVMLAIDRLNSLDEPRRSSGDAIEKSNGLPGLPYSIVLMHKAGDTLHTAQKEYAARSCLASAMDDLGLSGLARQGRLRMEFLGDPHATFAQRLQDKDCPIKNVPVEDWESCCPESGATVLVGEWAHFPKWGRPTDDPDPGIAARPAGAMDDGGETREGTAA